jgi:hypothetical protein
MVKGCPELERGESASKTGRRHIPTSVFKQAESLTKQAAVIETALAGINPLNAGKKKDELIPLIKRFIPGMEDYLAVVRRYKGEFERQERVNASLKKKERLEAQQLRQNYERLKTVYNTIPEDIRREAAAQVNRQRQRPQHDRESR